MSERIFIDHLIQAFSQLPMNNTQTNNDSSIQSEQIQAKARELWQKAGSPEGRDLEFWLAAEHELRRESEDVNETKNGVATSPARSTPSGAEPADGKKTRASSSTASKVRRRTSPSQ
jgi:hypothetical protein